MEEAKAPDVDPRQVIRPTAYSSPPGRPTQLCRGCGKMLPEECKVEGLDLHPGCSAPRAPDFTANASTPTERPFGSDHPMRSELLERIKYANANSQRSLQSELGPSEVGTPCDRRIAMRMAGVRKVNRSSDPWAAIVGTSIHAWLQSALEMDNERYVHSRKPPRWMMEVGVQPDPILRGKSDLYDTHTRTVIDWKTMGDTAERKLLENGPSVGYRTQIQIYGLGFYRAGYPVENVALMFLPRSGMLGSARYFQWPFSPAEAQAAIERVYRIGRNVIAMKANGEIAWESVPCDKSELCGWCPFFSRNVKSASSGGCPGQ